jgi:hypothetical protein
MGRTNQNRQLIAAALVFFGTLILVFSTKSGKVVTVEKTVHDTVFLEQKVIGKEIDTVYSTRTRFFQKWEFDSIYFVVERDTIKVDSIVRDTLIIKLADTIVLPYDSLLLTDTLGKYLFTQAYFGKDTTEHYQMDWAIGINNNELVYFEPVITVNPGASRCTVKEAIRQWWHSLKSK